MSCWYIKAKKYEWTETAKKTEGLFGRTKKVYKLNSRIIEGKVLGISTDGGYGSYEAITVVTKEGKNPIIEKISRELGVPLDDPNDYMGERQCDEILELRYDA